MKKRIFSGAQPTGKLHIGNYLGALKNWVKLQDDYDALYCIVNLHAITLPQDPEVLRRNILDLAKIYLASGVEPNRIFLQSDVPAHAELAWVLSCNTRMGELERMTQFTDKSQKNLLKSMNDHEEIEIQNFPEKLRRMLDSLTTGRELKLEGNVDARSGSIPTFGGILRSLKKLSQENANVASVGLFTYPVLMAADILLYQTDLVPVGKDQKQHLELSRDLAIRFNRDFGETFVVPEPYIPPVGASISSLQDPAKKMSKSDENANGSIFLADNPETILKKFKKAVTDSGTDIKFDTDRPAINNLLTIYQLVTEKSPEECEANFVGKGYGHLKTELADAVIEFLKPFQAKMNEYSDEDVRSVLKNGAQKANDLAALTLKNVYDKVGFSL